MSVVAGVPVKQFGVAKRRLASVLPAAVRSDLGRTLAQRTLEIVDAAGSTPFVLAADPVVAAWGAGLGYPVVETPPGLDRAAAVAAQMAGTTHRWVVVHADLPLLQPADLAPLLTGPGWAIAPSRDGGTNVIAGTGPFRFRYGPGSFVRHLAAAVARGPTTVVVSQGLAIDLDTPADLDAAVTHPLGRWLSPYLGSRE